MTNLRDTNQWCSAPTDETACLKSYVKKDAGVDTYARCVYESGACKMSSDSEVCPGGVPVDPSPEPSPPPSPQPSPPPSMETETDTTGGSDDSDIPDQEVVTDDGTMNDEYWNDDSMYGDTGGYHGGRPSLPYMTSFMGTSMPATSMPSSMPPEPPYEPYEPYEPQIELHGNARYVGYLANCVVFADNHGDGKRHSDSPWATTDAYGGYQIIGDASKMDGAALIVEPSKDCTDVGTDQALPVTLKALPDCELISVLSTIQAEMVGDGGEESTADQAIMTGLGLSGKSIDLCTLNPIESVWNKDQDLEEALAIQKATVEIVAVTAVITGVIADDKSPSKKQAAGEAIIAQIATQQLQSQKADGDDAGEFFEDDEATKSLVQEAAKAADTPITPDVLETCTDVADEVIEFVGDQMASIDTTDEIEAIRAINELGAFGSILTEQVTEDGQSLEAMANALDQAVGDTSQMEEILDKIVVPEPTRTPSPPPPAPPPPAPPPSDIPEGMTRFYITVAGDIADIPDGSEARTTFEADVKTELAKLAGAAERANEINIISVSAASIKVGVDVPTDMAQKIGEAVERCDQNSAGFTTLANIQTASSEETAGANAQQYIVCREGPKAGQAVDDDSLLDRLNNRHNLFFLLLLLLFLVIVIWFASVAFYYKGHVSLYFAWVFSHSNPYVVCLYRPAELRKTWKAQLDEIRAGREGHGATTATVQVDVPKDEKKDVEKKAEPVAEGAPGPSSAGEVDPANPQYRI